MCGNIVDLQHGFVYKISTVKPVRNGHSVEKQKVAVVGR